jgi:hypothetical protein
VNAWVQELGIPLAGLVVFYVVLQDHGWRWALIAALSLLALLFGVEGVRLTLAATRPAVTIRVTHREGIDRQIMAEGHNIPNGVVRFPNVLVANAPTGPPVSLDFSLRYVGDGTTGPENEALAGQSGLRQLFDGYTLARTLSPYGPTLPDFPKPTWYDSSDFDPIIVNTGETRHVNLAFVLVSSASPLQIIALEVEDRISQRRLVLPGAAGAGQL